MAARKKAKRVYTKKVETPVSDVPNAVAERYAFLVSGTDGVFHVRQAECVEQALASARKENRGMSHIRVHRITIHESATYNA